MPPWLLRSTTDGLWKSEIENFHFMNRSHQENNNYDGAFRGFRIKNISIPLSDKNLKI